MCRKETVEQLREFVKKYESGIISEAAKLGHEDMPELTEEIFSLFEKNGNRLIYENVYFTRRKYLLVYGIASYLTGLPENIAALTGVIENICSEECWALPAHVDRRYEQWRTTLDLFACETAQSLAEIITLVPQTDENVKKTAVSNILDRVLMPFFYTGKCGFETNTSNWSAVCAGSIGTAAIYLKEYIKDEVFENIILRVNNAMKYYISGFSDDGICYEGLDYWNYGMSYFVMYQDMLLKHVCGNGNESDILKEYMLLQPKVLKIMQFQGKCYFSSGKTVCFSDGNPESGYRAGLAAYIAKITGENMPDIARAGNFDGDGCYRFACGYRDIVWTKEYIEHLENEPDEKEYRDEKYSFFGEGMWAIMESGNGAGFAIKGGCNDEPHNHNDVGSFIYFLGNEEIIADLGAGEYTKDYFGDRRYTIFCNSAESHNIPIINGRYQQEGKERRATSFCEIDSGECTDKGIEVEFGRAYATSVRAIRRAFFDMESGCLKITDTFLAPEVDVEENLLLKIRPYVRNKPAGYNPEGLVFAVDDDIIIGHAVLRIESPESAGVVRVSEHIHGNHQGVDEKVWVLNWKCSGKDVSCKFSICQL